MTTATNIRFYNSLCSTICLELSQCQPGDHHHIFHQWTCMTHAARAGHLSETESVGAGPECECTGGLGGRSSVQTQRHHPAPWCLNPAVNSLPAIIQSTTFVYELLIWSRRIGIQLTCERTAVYQLVNSTCPKNATFIYVQVEVDSCSFSKETKYSQGKKPSRKTVFFGMWNKLVSQFKIDVKFS